MSRESIKSRLQRTLGHQGHEQQLHSSSKWNPERNALLCGFRAYG